jgi:hypothetical protein
MSKIVCREIHFAKATQPRQIDFLIDKIKEAVKEMKLPSEYDIRIYKNVFSCCGGVGGLGIIIEVVGSQEEKIKEIDTRVVSRILEFCEKEGYEMGHHSFGHLETM